MKKVKILGIELNPFTKSELNTLVNDSVIANNNMIICSQNLHSVYLYHHDIQIQNFQKISIKRVDGMPLIWLANLLGHPLKTNQRVTWVDWIYPLMSMIADQNWKVYYLGSEEKVLENGISKLTNKFPNLKIQSHHGFFNKEKNSTGNHHILSSLKHFDPDILIVGMGMPLQEHWILENLEDINAKVILTSGAAIEYVAGKVKTPPRWMGKVGLEWLYRLTGNPQRFWHRYLIEPWFILKLFIKDLYDKTKRK